MALLVIACIGCGRDISAAELALTGTLGQQLQYNDNIALSTVGKEAVVGYLLTPSLQATRKSGALDIGFQGQGLVSRYNESRWDCDNYNLGLNNAYRAKRSIFGLNGGYSVSCSYAQQLTQTGILVPNSQSTTYLLAPSWTWQWTPRDQIILASSYSKTSYSNSSGDGASNTGTGFSGNFSGNDTYSVNLSGNHLWTQRLSLNEKFNFSNIQYTGANASTQNLFGFQLGANYTINHYWAVSANGGPVWVDTPQQGSSEQASSLSLGSIVNINLSFNGQLATFATGYSNAVNPSAIGQTLQTQSIFASYSYRVSRHVLLDHVSSFSRSESIGGQSTDNITSQFNRSYFTTSPGIVWELEKNWRLRGSYTYRWQDYQQDNNVSNLNTGVSDSNLVMLSLSYSWDGAHDFSLKK